MSSIIKERQDDTNIFFLTVENDVGLKATFCSYGASVYDLLLNEKRLVLSIKDRNIYLNSAQYYGKTLGVVAGRINCDGDVDGKKYKLDETIKGHNFSLHGGHVKSLSFKNWAYTIEEDKKEMRVIFTIVTVPNENGFIGSSELKVIYTIPKNSAELKITFKEKGIENALVNLSNHIYWNLDSLDINEYYLQMNADKVGTMRDDLLVIGVEKVPSYLDFRKKQTTRANLDYIKENVITKTIDNTFIFDNGQGHVEMSSDKYELILDTDLPAMNIYVDSSMSDVKFKNNYKFGERRGIALEPQLFGYDHNCIILRKNEERSYNIIYKIKEL